MTTPSPAPSNPTSPASTETSYRVSVLGCGWLGMPLARNLVKDGIEVIGSTTTPNKLQLLSSIGVTPVLFRLEPAHEAIDSEVEPRAPADGPRDSRLPLARFFTSERMIVDIPPMTSLGEDYHLGQLQFLLSRLGSELKHLIYVSSTSVYGSHQGQVFEDTPPEPNEGSGKTLVRAEALLSQAAKAQGFALSIVRAGGLIGPQRHPGLFFAGKKDVKLPRDPVNLVHQHDLIACLAALAKLPLPSPGETHRYNAVSRYHGTREEFYTRATVMLGLNPPKFSSVEADRTTGHAGKLVNGEKLRAVTGVEFVFDDLLTALGDRNQ